MANMQLDFFIAHSDLFLLPSVEEGRQVWQRDGAHPPQDAIWVSGQDDRWGELLPGAREGLHRREEGTVCLQATVEITMIPTTPLWLLQAVGVSHPI